MALDSLLLSSRWSSDTVEGTGVPSADSSVSLHDLASHSDGYRHRPFLTVVYLARIWHDTASTLIKPSAAC